MSKKFMLQCLDEIVKELGNLKEAEYLPPHQHIAPGETVLATMNDESKRLCTLWNKLSAEGIAALDSLEKQGRFLISDLSEEEYEKLKLLDEKHSLISQIMWFSVQKQANAFTKDVGIRSNWAIVTPLSKPQNPLEAMLESLGARAIQI